MFKEPCRAGRPCLPDLRTRQQYPGGHPYQSYFRSVPLNQTGSNSGSRVRGAWTRYNALRVTGVACESHAEPRSWVTCSTGVPPQHGQGIMLSRYMINLVTHSPLRLMTMDPRAPGNKIFQDPGNRVEGSHPLKVRTFPGSIVTGNYRYPSIPT